MFLPILCAPIVDGHAVYFLLLPGPGGIIHKLLSGISPLNMDGPLLETIVIFQANNSKRI